MKLCCLPDRDMVGLKGSFLPLLAVTPHHQTLPALYYGVHLQCRAQHNSHQNNKVLFDRGNLYPD